MSDDLVTDLLPVLGRSLDPGFNVFDVMHHGSHEKQISNVFRLELTRFVGHGFLPFHAALSGDCRVIFTGTIK